MSGAAHGGQGCEHDEKAVEHGAVAVADQDQDQDRDLDRHQRETQGWWGR
ncbi:hypothetical protein [Streptomyces peucetius]|uniref:Uncharacterized protein n=1 Tax=Streptomyces peucetius TaxID=1950 RepID=A0ABY6I3L5_STRPE|nr:hypothetical protein [Streptomyces peucetius]UYQ60355.1 hypothetical protein OGH68_01930 [Streptomyces peucetius]